MSRETRVEHLWRLRRRGHRIDAELHEPDAADGVEVKFLYDGAVAHQRVWANRDQAIAEANRRRADLERSGWILHW